MGILLMAIFGMMPLGSVLIGAVSEHIGAPATVLAQGILAVIIALIFSKFLTKPLKKPNPETGNLEKLA
jgi:peptidoglycan/LPS O-acetylase OafA/YrhL